MLMFNSNELNRHMHLQSPYSGENYGTLFLMDGEMPASIKEFQNKTTKDLFEMCKVALSVTTRRSGRFAQFLHESVLKHPVSIYPATSNRIPAKSLMITGKSNGKTDRLLSEYSGNNIPLSRRIGYVSREDYHRSNNHGSWDGRYESWLVGFDNPVHLESIQIRAQPLTSTSSSANMEVYGYTEYATTFEQLDNTLDLSGAVENNTVRIRDMDNLPDALSSLGIMCNDVVCKYVSGEWTLLTMYSSFSRMRIGYNLNFRYQYHENWTLDQSSNLTLKRKFKYFSIESSASNLVTMFDFMYFTSDESAYEGMDLVPATNLTWALWSPDCTGPATPNRNDAPVSGDTPLMLLDVGGPNEGKAVTLNAATDIKFGSDVSLMNLKTFIGWMES